MNRYPNPREELIGLLRGFIAVPVLAELDSLGLIEVFLRNSFKPSDLSAIAQPHYQDSVVGYLTAIGLVAPVNDGSENFSVTSLGMSIFKRSGTAQIMYSYRDMLNSLDQILVSENFDSPECDREMNVRGSGKTHGAKFFGPTIEKMRDWSLATLVDLSAGDGNFLSRAVPELGIKNVLVNDLSATAVDIAGTSVAAASPPGVKVAECVGDARDISSWSESLGNHQHSHGDGVCIAAWFLLHEIAEGGVESIKSFLQEIRLALPKARVIVGELFRLDPAEVSGARHGSILPEFYFFHDFSGQAILSRIELEEAFLKAGYAVDFFIGFDPVGDESFSAGTYGLSPRHDQR